MPYSDHRSLDRRAMCNPSINHRQNYHLKNILHYRHKCTMKYFTELLENIFVVYERWQSAIAKVRYCHAMYKLLYPIALGSGQRLLCRLGSGLGLVLVLILRFCVCPADFCDSGPESYEMAEESTIISVSLMCSTCRWIADKRTETVRHCTQLTTTIHELWHDGRR